MYSTVLADRSSKEYQSRIESCRFQLKSRGIFIETTNNVSFTTSTHLTKENHPVSQSTHIMEDIVDHNVTNILDQSSPFQQMTGHLVVILKNSQIRILLNGSSSRRDRHFHEACSLENANQQVSHLDHSNLSRMLMIDCRQKHHRQNPCCIFSVLLVVSLCSHFRREPK